MNPLTLLLWVPKEKWQARQTLRRKRSQTWDFFWKLHIFNIQIIKSYKTIWFSKCFLFKFVSLSKLFSFFQNNFNFQKFFSIWETFFFLKFWFSNFFHWKLFSFSKIFHFQKLFSFPKIFLFPRIFSFQNFSFSAFQSQKCHFEIFFIL